MYKKSNRIILLITLSLFLLNPSLFSQSKENGAFEGKIIIEDGQPLPGVMVTAINTSAAGAKRTTVTDENGRFRFPALLPGVYDLEAQLEGFQTAKREGIRLTVGTTLTVDFRMNLGKIEERVTVAGVLPMVDVKDSQTAVSSLSNEILQNIPNNQFVSNIVNMAPGVNQSTAFGATDGGIQYQIDGVDVSDPELHTAYVFLDYGTVEEAKVMGIGAPAEYDGFTGVVFNTVTKSGGNQFEGMLDTFIQPDSWNAKNSDDPALSSPKSAFKNIHLSLGGPITKNKLWFFAALQYYRSDRTPSGWEAYDDTIAYDQPRAFIKLTWQPNEKNSLQGFLEGDLYTGKNRGANRYTPPETTVKQRSPETCFNLNFLHVFSNQTFLETKFGGFLSYYKLIPASGYDVSGVVDWGTGMKSVNASWFYHAYRERYSLTSAVSHHADKFITGSHDFKFGIDAEMNPTRTEYGFPNVIAYKAYDGEPYMAYGYEGYNTSATNLRISGYIQDSWAVTDKLKLNPGLRLNYYRGSLKGIGTVFTPKMALAPRIGITYDLFADHSTTIKAHYGRMFENIISSYYTKLAPVSDYISYSYDPDSATYVENWRDVWDPEKYSIDPDISMPYVDQFTVGVERELVKDLTLGVTYIYRNFQNFIDRVNTTGEFEKVADSYTDSESGITYNIPYYVQTNPGENRYMLTNPVKGQYPIVGFTPFRKYNSIQIQINKRFSNGWQLLASYVYSNTKGTYDTNYSGDYSAGVAASSIFVHPNFQINLEGRPTHDIPHQIKIQGTVVLPWEINLSGFYSFLSGNTYSDYVYVSLPDPEGGAANIMPEAMGSKRYPAQHNLDLQVEKIFTIKGKLRVSVMVSAFNIFNAATVVGLNSTLNISDPYGSVNALVNPRVFRAGMRVYF
jgi:outer membrane receptor protein involved in Fe transport